MEGKYVIPWEITDAVFVAGCPSCPQTLLKTFTVPHIFFNPQQTPEGRDVAPFYVHQRRYPNGFQITMNKIDLQRFWADKNIIRDTAGVQIIITICGSLCRNVRIFTDKTVSSVDTVFKLFNINAAMKLSGFNDMKCHHQLTQLKHQKHQSQQYVSVSAISMQ